MATVKNHVRATRPKTASQIAKRDLNIRIHHERTMALAMAQRQEQARVRKSGLIHDRLESLFRAADSAPSYRIWCKINKRPVESYGSAAAFFWRYPQEHPSGLATGRTEKSTELLLVADLNAMLAEVPASEPAEMSTNP